MSKVAVSQLRIFAHHKADVAEMTSMHRHPTHGFTQQGNTAHFVVSYANSLGAHGQTIATAVLAKCEGDFAGLQGYFGGITPASMPFNIFIQPGNNGASHATCLATELHCDAFNGTDTDLVSSLVVAEADEVFMAAQNAGWECGGSNGEGLSRVLATERYPKELTPPGLGISFATGPSWLDSPDRPDWVNQTEPTDQDFVATGCATLFINYLRYQLGYSLDNIVQAAGSTLSQTYTRLTGNADGWAPFLKLLNQHFPQGRPSGLINDNPFPLA